MDFELAAGDFQERCSIVKEMPDGEKVRKYRIISNFFIRVWVVKSVFLGE